MSEGPGSRDPDELELNKAAYLSAYERDATTGKPLTQDKIANRLGTTREQVNRYLQQARQRGILRSEYAPPSEEVLDRIILELNYTDITKVLKDYCDRHKERSGGRAIESVTVVCDELSCNHQDSWDESLLRFGPLTAAKTKQFIHAAAKRPSATLGVAWGRILRSVIDAVSVNDFAEVRGKRHVQTVPLWGEVWGPEILEWKGKIFKDRDRLSSSTLARDLEAKLTRQDDRRKRHSLNAVPIMLPRELAEHQEVLFQYLTKVSAWGAIFGPRKRRADGSQSATRKRPLAESLHLLLAGAGSPENPDRFLSPEVLRNILSKKDANRLLQVVYGDVAGVLLERPGLGESDQALLAGIHASWTGVREEHLRRCAARARAGKAVGVVVYAIHKSRAQPILEAIRRGLVTHLVTEMGLAAELKRLAKQSM